MRIYTAHLRPGRFPVLVAEGFSWGAFLFGPLWLIGHRAWVAAALLLAGLLVATTVWFGPVAGFGLQLLAGLFGNDWRRWSLGLGRFELAHVVAGRSHEEAMLRLLSAQDELRRDVGARAA